MTATTPFTIIGMQEAVDRTGLSDYRIKRAIAEERIPGAYKVGSRYRIPISELAEFAKAEGATMSETAAPHTVGETTGEAPKIEPPTGNGISIEGTAVISANAPAIGPDDQPEGEDNQLADPRQRGARDLGRRLRTPSSETLQGYARPPS